jgi:hypothetical protein
MLCNSAIARDRHHHRHHHSDRSKAAAAAIAAAVVVGAAVAAAKSNRDRYKYEEHGRHFDDRPRMWFPATGVTCYRDQRACYKVGRGYSPHWTRREFF